MYNIYLIEYVMFLNNINELKYDNIIKIKKQIKKLKINKK